MKNILFILIFSLSTMSLLSQTEPTLEWSKLKIDLPITNAEMIEASKLEKEKYYVFRFYFSAATKEENKLFGKHIKYQPYLSSYIFSLCEALRNCEDMTFRFPEGVTRNDFLNQETRYSEESKSDYDVVLYFDKELELKSVEKVIKTFNNTKKIANVFLAYRKKSESNPILLYNFNPKKASYMLDTSNDEKYSDWVNNDFKIQYGEVITIAED